MILRARIQHHFRERLGLTENRNAFAWRDAAHRHAQPGANGRTKRRDARGAAAAR